eukprot:1140551-Pelagomonas_calceolata.AAC.1
MAVVAVGDISDSGDGPHKANLNQVALDMMAHGCGGSRGHLRCKNLVMMQESRGPQDEKRQCRSLQAIKWFLHGFFSKAPPRPAGLLGYRARPQQGRHTCTFCTPLCARAFQTHVDSVAQQVALAIGQGHSRDAAPAHFAHHSVPASFKHMQTASSSRSPRLSGKATAGTPHLPHSCRSLTLRLTRSPATSSAALLQGMARNYSKEWHALTFMRSWYGMTCAC